MSKRVFSIQNITLEDEKGLLLTVDASNFSDEDFLGIQELSTIIDNAKKDSNDLEGQIFSLGNIKVYVNDLTTYENLLIKL
jgi:hypothetical protein